MGTLSDLLSLAHERADNLRLPYQGALTPAETWQVMQLAPGAKLVDVRTRAELDWVGRVPGAVEIEWKSYPSMQENPNFLAQLKHQVDPEALVLFLCRSAARSDSTARLASASGYANCYNVLEGFEGDRDANNQRNRIGGWRHAGLPWYQG